MGCSGEQKVTEMVLKVDLQCCECYLKVKRLLCKFPQIRDQVFDEKQNTVTITVVCCTPERIRDKLCSKGRKSIKSIEIKEPRKPDPEKPNSKPEDKPKPAAAAAPAPAPAPVEPEKPKPKPKADPEPQAPAPPAQEKPPEKLQKNGSKSGSKKSEPAAEPKPAADNPAVKQAEAAPAPAPAKQAEPEAQWVPGAAPPPQQAQMSLYPVAICYDGVPGGPWYQGGGYGPNNYGYAYGRPSYPPPGYYPSNANRCSDYNYFSEENPSACAIM